jgi:hypothetical protein
MLQARFHYPRLSLFLAFIAAAGAASCSTEERNFTGATSTGGGMGGGGGEGGSGGSGGVNLCGNSALDDGEACDGDCPTECIDPDLCTQNQLTGTAEECDAACSFKPTVTCVKNDGCCPTGCHPGNDSDCAMDVLVVAGDANGLPGVKASLDSLGIFGTVATFDAYANILTEADVMNKDAVLVYTNASFPNPDALGNVLANFHDSGGRVVVAPGANCVGFGIGGRFLAEGYGVLGYGNANPNEDTLGEVLEPNSPLMVDIQSVMTSTHCDGQPAGDAKAVAKFATSGDPIIVRGTVKGRSRVDINIYPGNSLGQGNNLQLVRNALLYQ